MRLMPLDPLGQLLLLVSIGDELTCVGSFFCVYKCVFEREEGIMRKRRIYVCFSGLKRVGNRKGRIPNEQRTIILSKKTRKNCKVPPYYVIKRIIFLTLPLHSTPYF